MTPPINSVSVDDLAQEIRRIDGNKEMGAGALAEAIMAFLAALRAANTPVGDGEIGECRYCANTGWFYGDPDLQTFCGCAFGKLREELSASPALPSQVVEDAEVEMTWRDLALQFDGHRIDALSQLKYAVRCIEEYATVRDILREPLQSLKAFLAAPPLSGEKVLAARIQPCITSPAAEPVAYMLPVTHEVLGQTGWAFYSKAGERKDYEPGEYEAHVQSIAGAVPLYTHPAPSASREVTEAERTFLQRLRGDDFGIVRHMTAAEKRVGYRLKEKGLVALDGAISSSVTENGASFNGMTFVLTDAGAALTLPERGM